MTPDSAPTAAEPAAPPVRVERVSFRESGQFSARDVAYAERDPALAPFMAYPPTLAAFAKTIAARTAWEADRRYGESRQTLLDVVREQYGSYRVKLPADVDALLDPQTFTITTAHQASLFLGPLYYVYKILSAVALCRSLSERYPEQRFVPAFVLGAEDHDFDEIDHLRFRGKTYRWKTEQTGATGAMRLADLQPTLEALLQDLGPSTHARKLERSLREAYAADRTLGEATAGFVAELFRDYGVVVVNLTHPRFKRQFAPLIRREVLGRVSEPLIAETVAQLETAGFAQQAHARRINFFYLRAGRRDRLEVDGEDVVVLDTDLRWGREAVAAEIEAHPERFSPNVVMRPLLQEICLPNLAYVGGGGELAYWLERRAQFAEFDVPFPVLVRRDSAWWIGDKQARTLAKLGLRARDLLGDEHALLRAFVTEHSATDVAVDGDVERLRALFEDLSERAARVDPTLRMKVLADGQRSINEVERLGKRLVRELKRQQEHSIDTIQRIRAELLPDGGLQERTDSFMDLYVRHGGELFDTLLAAFDPLDMRLKVFEE